MSTHTTTINAAYLSMMSAAYTMRDLPLGVAGTLSPAAPAVPAASPPGPACIAVARRLGRPARECRRDRLPEVGSALPAALGPPSPPAWCMVVRLLLGWGGEASVLCSSRAVRMSSTPRRRTCRGKGRQVCFRGQQQPWVSQPLQRVNRFACNVCSQKGHVCA